MHNIIELQVFMFLVKTGAYVIAKANLEPIHDS